MGLVLWASWVKKACMKIFLLHAMRRLTARVYDIGRHVFRSDFGWYRNFRNDMLNLREHLSMKSQAISVENVPYVRYKGFLDERVHYGALANAL